MGRALTAVMGAALLDGAALCAQTISADSTRPPADVVDGAERDGAGRRDDDAPHHRGASPLVPQTHWAVRAARRADALGLIPGYLPAQGAVPRHALAQALERAAIAADGTRLQPLAEGWLSRFYEEFGEYRRAVASPLALLGGRVQAGYESEAGRLTPAISYGPWRIDPKPVRELSAARVRAEGAVRLGGFGAAYAQGRADQDGAALPRWEAVAAAGSFSASVGRQAVGYGPGVGGAVVFYPNAPLTRLEVQTTRPLELPSVLRYAGPVSLHTFFSRMSDPGRHPDEAWLWGARVAFQPHARLTLAVNRGSVFGSERERISLSRLLRMTAGVIRSSNFENQILSFDGRLRLPTERWLPVTLYAETGADDGAGALDEVPGTVAGVFIPALPGLPQVAVGGEYTRFSTVCCGHGPWYFNSSQTGNWARGSHPLGHPLGGEGDEALVYAQADLLDGRLRLDGRAFRRSRSNESLEQYGGANLFAPLRVGRSSGGSVDAALRIGRVDLTAAWFRDAGDGWRQRRLQAGAAAFF
ncbi:capsule assembly Wzi family protein [Longimicrobium terrae]|uniref:Capsule assembly Wzi family protein n=1 Tax=Longimicrobium terrae TaxID=1639882 RepID=A0A841GWH8_9BACT|nr:capsule assembly Wzi family protein [Longimicrobium terrae]MBB4634484.1 hypothetical protein [Longimicrobium terrae]MBB6068626.1 hypothetical protein [Longimicrobium terrae]NNC27812.1 hypothetical protein [Longimicrobium terrae]